MSVRIYSTCIFLVLAFWTISSNGFTVQVTEGDTDSKNGTVKQRENGRKLFQVLFRTRRLLASPCPRGEYYDTYWTRCRPCSKPCEFNKQLCEKLGCGDYLKTTVRPADALSTEWYFADTRQDRIIFGLVIGGLFPGLVCLVVYVIILNWTCIRQRALRIFNRRNN